jgi:uncharacterized membrane protein
MHINKRIKINELKRLVPSSYKELDELALIALLVIILPLIIWLSPSGVARIILGLPLVLFLPGYTLLAALYVKKDQLKGINRLALSCGLSIAIVPIIGLILNYIPWGIRLVPFYAGLGFFILIMVIIAGIRRGRLPKAKRFAVNIFRETPAWRGKIVQKSLQVLFVPAALAVVGSLIFIVIVPKSQENFTEFYITGIDSSSAYPAVLTAGIEQNVLVDVINREKRTLEYRIEIITDQQKQSEVGPITLADGQKYESQIGFTLAERGKNQLVEFVLYTDNQSEPYLEPLRLWVNVR